MERILGAFVLIFAFLTFFCFIYVVVIGFYIGLSYLFGYDDLIGIHNWLCYKVIITTIVCFGLTMFFFILLFIVEALKGNDV